MASTGSPGKALMATDIPAAITIPDSVETRLGTLRFTDGFPDDETVQKLAKTLQEALRDPDLVKRFNEINTEPVPQNEATPEALKAKLISEVDRWAPIVKAANQFAD